MNSVYLLIVVAVHTLVFSVPLKASEEKVKAEESSVSAQEVNKNLYATFCAIERLHEITSEVSQTMQKKHGTMIVPGRELYPEPNPFYSISEQGLFLSVGTIPETLFTPWGEVRLSGSCSGDYMGFFLATKMFLDRLNYKFAGINNMVSRSVYSEVMLDPKNNTYELKKLTAQDIKAALGSEKLIFSSNANSTALYAVRKVDGITLPEPKFWTHRPLADTKTQAFTDWKTMSKLYQAEHAQKKSK